MSNTALSEFLGLARRFAIRQNQVSSAHAEVLDELLQSSSLIETKSKWSSELRKRGLLSLQCIFAMEDYLYIIEQQQNVQSGSAVNEFVDLLVELMVLKHRIPWSYKHKLRRAAIRQLFTDEPDQVGESIRIPLEELVKMYVALAEQV